MEKLKILTRVWTVAIDKYAVESSPLAVAHAEQLLDITVAGSVQSLRETLDELKRVEEMVMLELSQLEERSKGFRNRVDYRQQSAAFEKFLHILAGEIETYEARVEANRFNDGKSDLSAVK